MKKYLLLFAVLLLVPFFLGCPGNGKGDIKAQQDLWAWVEQQDTNGWTITGYEQNAGFYKHIILDHRFRPTHLDIAINGDAVNPLHQRNLIEDIARHWRNSYPANMYPRFNLKVEIYNQKIDKNSELGYTEIDKDGNVDTHHSKTQDMI
jgi:hypothetical protein